MYIRDDIYIYRYIYIYIYIIAAHHANNENILENRGENVFALLS
jgi:hypothetical protein